MSIFDPAKIARNKAIVDAMPEWKRGEPINRRRVSDVDKLKAVKAQLLEALEAIAHKARRAELPLTYEIKRLAEAAIAAAKEGK